MMAKSDQCQWHRHPFTKVLDECKQWGCEDFYPAAFVCVSHPHASRPLQLGDLSSSPMVVDDIVAAAVVAGGCAVATVVIADSVDVVMTLQMKPLSLFVVLPDGAHRSHCRRH
jgi:hypothetical protein